MNKRDFLTAASATLALPAVAQAAPAVLTGPVLLTLTGQLARTNRGPFDPVADQMMAKQKLSFTKAWAVDYRALVGLPQRNIAPTLEYDGKLHRLRGPRLLDVVALSGTRVSPRQQLVLRAVDGYAAVISAEEARLKDFILATHLDGQPMPLGGLGPLWAVYDADRIAEAAAKPLGERFAACPWALYHIEVQG